MHKIKPEPVSKFNIHATGLVFDGVGILIQGASGTGKSLLALTLLEFGELAGKNAILVGDDRLDISIKDRQLNMTAPAAIAGKIELRGFGILARPHAMCSRVDLLVDLVPVFDRLPEKKQLVGELLGVILQRCPVPQSSLISLDHQRFLLVEAVAAFKANQPH